MKQIKFYSFIVPLIIGLIALASLGVTVNEKLQGEAPAKFAEGQGELMLGGLISKPYTFSPNTVIRSSEINSNYDTLYTLVNGNIDNDNIDASAEIAYTKISGSAILANPVASQTITPGGATYQFIVKGASSQSVDIFDIQNSSAVSQLSVDSSGYTNIDSDYLYFSTSTERIQSTGSGDMTFTDTNSGATWTLTQLANASALTEGDGVDISANVISVIPSTTLGYTFDTGGYLYRPVDSTLTATSTGLSVNTSTVVSQIATSTPTADKIPIADGSNKLDEGWLDTRFGGDGTDGALTLADTTTTIDLTNSDIVIKNYTSISIDASSTLNFSNASTTGSYIVLRSQGDCTIAGTIDGRNTGADGGASVTAYSGIVDGNTGSDGDGLFSSNAGVKGLGAGGNGAGGTAPSADAERVLWIHNIYPTVIIGAGGGSGGANRNDASGSATSGKGGDGSGFLVIECAGSLNFTGTVNHNGSNGGDATTIDANYAGGGGGGASGYFGIFYNELTINTGSITVSGGSGGNYITSADRAGGGGGGYSAGIAGSSGYGGNGSSGRYIIQKNNYHY